MSADAAFDAETAAARVARRAFAAFAIGTTLGATATAGTALLLYTGQGFLRAAGLLVASTIMAVAAGLWAGTPDDDALPRTRVRWLVFVAALGVSGAFVVLWLARAGLRGAALGGALAVLLVLAVPAYTAGALLAALHARDRVDDVRGSGAALAALAGSAIGVMLATGILIQAFEAWGIYFGGAVIAAVAVLLDRAPAHPHRSDRPMTDRAVLITGVSDRGQLGYCVARRFLDAGASIMISARTADLATLSAELSAAGTVAARHADLGSDEDVTALINATLERFGRIDALVNLAGGLSVVGSVEQTSAEEWRGEIERNAGTAYRVTRAALPHLRSSRGAVINFASPAGLRAAADLAAYSGAKAALIAFTRSLAIEERDHGVRVNAIAPGLIDTAQNREAADGAKFVTREEVADVAVFLASDAARGVTGETVLVLGRTI